MLIAIWLLAVLAIAEAVLLVAEHVGWAESRRQVRYLRGRLRAYRGSGRGDYEAVLVAVGLLGRFLVRAEFADLDDCTCEDCEYAETWDDEPDWLDDLFADFRAPSPADDLLSPDPFNLIHRPALRCFDALCKVCDLRRATDDVTRTETDQ